MRKAARVAALILLCAGISSCRTHKLHPDEIDRNRLFAEMLKRSDHREIGTDGFFERATLTSPYSEAREWGAIALGRIGDPAALPILYEAMCSPDAALRAAAAFATGEIEDREILRVEGRQPHAETIPRLRHLLDDTAVAVRMRAVEALGKAGLASEAGEIARRLRNVRPEQTRVDRAYVELSITALTRLKASGELETLHALALSRDPDIQSHAAGALCRLEDRTAFPVFRKLLEIAPDPDARAYAARGMGVCGDRTAIPYLLSLLQEQPQAVRVCAVQALGNLRPPEAVKPIASALAAVPADDDHPEQVNFAAAAAAALGQIGSADAVPVLSSLVGSPAPASNAAVIALATLLRSDPGHFFATSPRSRFSGPAELRAWARALGELGGPAAISELHSILRASFDESGTSAEFLAIPTVIESLAKVQAPDMDTTVATFLNSHEGPVMRAALAAYKPQPGSAKPWVPVVEAYRRIAAGPDVETKTALLDRLEPWAREPDVVAALEGALKDRARNARIAAARVLRSIGRSESALDPGPAETGTTQITYDLLASNRKDRTVAIIETNRGNIEIELFRQDAPMTVANFVSLARRGFYDGLTFMRVVPFFVIQGGDPRNDMEGGPGYTIRCEINMRPYRRGSIGMALAGKDTGGSQFFITLAPQPRLDGGFTCFGQVISGMPVADRIIAGDRIKKIRIEDDVTAMDYRQY